MSRNRLADATSPYLLQHKDNPVHWWPWCAEAIEEAKRTNRPILLSVGYAACHWCHVMAHESFEDEATAEVMNRLFVNIKVDREERPDIDAIYMNALHLLGQQGGWPLTMFLDTDARPFFGGTYFPKQSLYGRPAFTDVLEKISHIYNNEYDKVAHNTAAILTELEKSTRARQSASGHLLISDDLLEDLTGRMVKAVDPDHGGLTGAPKFPQWSFFWLLWRGAIRYGNEAAGNAVINTLRHICQGGIYDHLGGGFARYSVDELWLVPHFEKMLYDNALLLDLLTEVYRETHDPLFAARIRETVGWLEREMIAQGGAFAASLDADSEGGEGKFYVWSFDEIAAVLGADDARVFCKAYDISPSGNWEGTNIPNRLHDLTFDASLDRDRLTPLRQKLFEHREKRIRPGWDDKVLADWNGLMIASLVHAGQAMGEPAWIERARTAFDFVVGELSQNGRLKHTHRAGKSAVTATGSDYANMIWAALRLYQATGELTFLTEAARLTATLNAHHWIDAEKRFATTADDADDVIVRLATGTDDAVPGPNGIMVTNLAHLALATGNNEYVRQAAEMIDGFSAEMGANPVAHATLLAGAMDILRPQQVAIFTPGEEAETNDGDRTPLTQALFALSLPGALEFVTADRTSGLSPALEGKSSLQGKPAAYVCLGPQCSLPITTPEDLTSTLQEQRRRPPKQEPPPEHSS